MDIDPKTNPTASGIWKIISCPWVKETDNDSNFNTSSWCNGVKLHSFSAIPATEAVFVLGNYTKMVGHRFHEGLNSDCHTLLINKDTLLIEEQSKAHHNFFARRHNIDI